MQEVDDKTDRSGGVDQAKALAQSTNLNGKFAAAIPFQGGNYGLAMLTELTPARSWAMELPPGLEPRVAQFTELTYHCVPLVAVNVHFDHADDDSARILQASALVAALSGVQAVTIVAGDFNDTPSSRSLAMFYDAGFQHVDTPGASWPADSPTEDIDHILIRDGRTAVVEIISGGVADEDKLSDHRPVAGTILLKSHAISSKLVATDNCSNGC